MKKIIIVFVVFSFVASLLFFNQFSTENQKEFMSLTSIGQNSTTNKTVINIGSLQPDEAYNSIKGAIDKFGGSISYLNTENHIYTTYIYYNEQSFPKINLMNGRLFTASENESNYFLSTIKTKDKNQIGQIKSFSGNDKIFVKTIKSNLSTSTFNKTFYISLKKQSDFLQFQNMLKAQDIFITSDQSQGQGAIANVNTFASLSKYIVFIPVLCLVLLILYEILNSYKKIGIEKMLGSSNFQILKKRFFPILLSAFCSMIISLIICCIINFSSLNSIVLTFILNLLKTYAIVYLISAFLIFLPFLNIRKIKISDMLKNRRPTNAIMFFNTFVKLTASIILIIVAVNSFSQLQLSVAKYGSSYNKWESTKNYYITPYVESPGNAPIADWNSYDNLNKFKNIYMECNKTGLIDADFYCLTNEYLTVNNLKLNDLSSYATVNPNYMKSNPIYDENNKIVNISENEKQFVLLVPKMYKSKEKEILNNDLTAKNGYPDYVDDKGKTISSNVRNQAVKIIWIKDNQKLFTYKLNINPSQSNCEENSVVRVLTESNGDIIDYQIMGDDPQGNLLIKQNGENSISQISNIFAKQFDSSKYTFPAESVYNSVNDQIAIANKELEVYLIGLFILIIIIATIIIQNVTNFFEQNKRRLAIQSFLGFKDFSKYSGFLLVSIASFIITTCIAFVFLESLTVIFISTIVFVLELLISIILLKINGKRNMIAITKGA